MKSIPKSNILVSFDVVPLFTNVHINLAIDDITKR